MQCHTHYICLWNPNFGSLQNAFKVIYPRYSKHWLSTVAHTINAVKYLIMGYYFHFSSFLGEKTLQINFRIHRFLFCLIFQFYSMYRLICQKPAHFACPNGFGEQFFTNVYSIWDTYVTLNPVRADSVKKELKREFR